MASSKGGVKLLKLTINEQALGEFLGKEIEPALIAYGEKLTSQVQQVQPAEGGWKAKIWRRPSRSTVVIYTEDEKIRFKEATTGKINKWLRSKITKGNIKLRKTKNGFEPMGQGEEI